MDRLQWMLQHKMATAAAAKILFVRSTAASTYVWLSPATSIHLYGICCLYCCSFFTQLNFFPPLIKCYFFIYKLWFSIDLHLLYNSTHIFWLWPLWNASQLFECSYISVEQASLLRKTNKILLVYNKVGLRNTITTNNDKQLFHNRTFQWITLRACFDGQ